MNVDHVVHAMWVAYKVYTNGYQKYGMENGKQRNTLTHTLTLVSARSRTQF